MRLSSAVEKFAQDCRDRGLVQSTWYRYANDLKILVALATVEAQDSVFAFTPDLVKKYFRRLSEKGLTMATLHRRRAALSEFSKWGVKERLWPYDIVNASAPKIRRPRYVPRPFSSDERARLIARPLDPVERLLRAVLFYTGLRVTPICGIRLADVSLTPVELVPGVVWPGSIRTVGKGSKPHVVPMHPELRDLIFDYVTTKTDLNPRRFLFAQKSGRPWSRLMVERRTRAWGAAAEPAVFDCTPHRFRHTTATVLLEAGVDLRVIQKFLAHEDISTTVLYTKVADRQLLDAVLKMPSFSGEKQGGVTASGSVPQGDDPGKASRKVAE